MSDQDKYKSLRLAVQLGFPSVIQPTDEAISLLADYDALAAEVEALKAKLAEAEKNSARLKAISFGLKKLSLKRDGKWDMEWKPRKSEEIAEAFIDSVDTAIGYYTVNRAAMQASKEDS